MKMIVAVVFLAAGFSPSSAAQPGPGAAERARVEQQLRFRMGEVVQSRLGLNAQQMQQLNTANRKFDRDRVALIVQERRVRMAIRDQIEAGDKGSQDRIASLLDSTVLLERRRLDLLESEQKQLAVFLTPRQRAQYFGLQTQMRNRMEEMRRSRGERGGVRRIPPR